MMWAAVQCTQHRAWRRSDARFVESGWQPAGTGQV